MAGPAKPRPTIIFRSLLSIVRVQSASADRPDPTAFKNLSRQTFRRFDFPNEFLEIPVPMTQ